MKFGVREIANCVFKAKTSMKIGSSNFKAGQPVLYIDTAKTSTLEGAATTVYAQGGRGNSRLIAWEGEKTLTFTVEDALLSPIGFAILSGAGLFHPKTGDTDAGKEVHAHMTAQALVSGEGVIDLTDALGANEEIDEGAPVFVIETEADGSITGNMVDGLTVSGKTLTGADDAKNKTVFVDFYVVKSATGVHELQIDAENFAGYFYVEADTLFRDQATGKDMPANITLPNVKIQSNFTFSMASTGDPSTFTFTMDAMPGYTFFEKTRKVLCVIQVIDETAAAKDNFKTVMEHNDDDTDFYDLDDGTEGANTADSKASSSSSEDGQ